MTSTKRKRNPQPKRSPLEEDLDRIFDLAEQQTSLLSPHVCAIERDRIERTREAVTKVLRPE